MIHFKSPDRLTGQEAIEFQVMPDLTGLGASESAEDKSVASKGMADVLRQLLLDEKQHDTKRRKITNSKDFGAMLRKERLTNKEFIVRADNGLRHTLGLPLSTFLPCNRLGPLQENERREREYNEDGEPRVVRYAADGRAVVEMASEHLEALSLPKIHIAVDLGVGHSAWWWCLHGLGLRATHTWDVCHRIMNDKDSALEEAGLTILRQELRTCLRVRQGPFKPGGANHRTITEASSEFFDLSNEHSLLWQILYDDVVENFFPDDADIGSEQHIKKTFDWARSFLLKAGTGGDHKDNRWFSFETKSRRMIPSIPLLLLPLVWLGTRREWWSVSKCPLVSRVDVVGKDGLEQPLPGEEQPAVLIEEAGADASAPARAAASAEEAAAAAAQEGDDGATTGGPSHTRVSVAQARAEARKRRQACSSTLMYCTNVFCRRLDMRLWRVMAYIAAPLEAFFNEELLPRLKSRLGTQSLHLDFSLGFFSDLGMKQLKYMISEDLASKLQFAKPERHPHNIEINQDKSVADVVFVYTRHLVGMNMLTGWYYSAPPFIFQRLAGGGAGARDAALTALQKLWNAFQTVERTSVGDKRCRAWVRNLAWPLQQWVMEVLLMLWACDFQRVPQQLFDDIVKYSRSLLSTLANENLHNKARGVQSLNRKGGFSPENFWHTSFSGSNVLEEMGRAPMKLTPTARRIAPYSVGDHVYDYVDNACSLEQAALDDLTSPAPTWPTYNIIGLHSIGVSTQLLLATDGSWDKIDIAWLSLLFQPGSLVLKRTNLEWDQGKIAYLVLLATAQGAVAKRVRLKSHGEEKVVDFEEHKDEPITFIHVEDTDEWRAREIIATPPSIDTGEFIFSTLNRVQAFGFENSIFGGGQTSSLDNSIRILRAEYSGVRITRAQTPEGQLLIFRRSESETCG